jgi:hypothetical protein
MIGHCPWLICLTFPKKNGHDPSDEHDTSTEYGVHTLNTEYHPKCLTTRVLAEVILTRISLPTLITKAEKIPES